MQKESFTTGVVFTLLSATGIALVGLFGKWGGQDFSLEALIFWRYVSAFLLCFLFLWMCGKLRGGLSFQRPMLHFMRAFFVLGAQYSFYYYIQRETLLNGLVLLSLGPFLIPLIEWVVMRHRIGKSTWVSLIVSFIGVLCILQPDAGIFSLLSLVGVLAGICQGCSQVVFGMSRQHERMELSTLYMIFLCLVLSLIPYLAFAPSLGFKHPGNHWGTIGIIIMLGIASVMSQLTRAVAYQHGTPSRLATFLYFSILLGGVFDWLLFDQIPNALTALGTALVIGGGLLKIYLRSFILKNKP